MSSSYPPAASSILLCHLANLQQYQRPQQSGGYSRGHCQATGQLICRPSESTTGSGSLEWVKCVFVIRRWKWAWAKSAPVGRFFVVKMPTPLPLDRTMRNASAKSESFETTTAQS